MKKDNAQRQRDYRKSQWDRSQEVRLNTWLSIQANLALERLARHRGLSKKATLEQLLLAEDSQTHATLDPDSPAWDQYFKVTQ